MAKEAIRVIMMVSMFGEHRRIVQRIDGLYYYEFRGVLAWHNHNKYAKGGSYKGCLRHMNRWMEDVSEIQEALCLDIA